VGVARNTKVATLHEPPTPLFYFPWAQFQRRTGQLWLVATGGAPPPETAAALQRVARELDPDLVVVQAKTLADELDLLLFIPRVRALVLGFFGAFALALASVGLFGVVTHAVSRRTREVGIRMSLGAGRRAVISMVVREAMTVVLLGSLAGFLASLALVRLLEAYLRGVGSYDPVTLTVVPILLAGVGALAALVPALKASRVNPVQALRAD
jgi:ABC-type antimicrobial peptide transport system permease subunit